MLPEADPTLPSEIRIPLPRQYRDYLIYQQNKRYVVGITLFVGVLLFFHFIAHWRFTDFTEVMLLIFSVIGWLYQIRKPWNYVIDAKHITVVWWQMGERVWDWFDVVWQRDAIMGAEESEWRGLPMLRIRRASKNSKYEPHWVMVFANEDAEMVRTLIIPLIEKYRHQHRQSTMAERLRS